MELNEDERAMVVTMSVQGVLWVGLGNPQDGKVIASLEKLGLVEAGIGGGNRPYRLTAAGVDAARALGQSESQRISAYEWGEG